MDDCGIMVASDDRQLNLRVLGVFNTLTEGTEPKLVSRCAAAHVHQWLFLEEPKPEKPMTAAISSSSSKSMSSSARRFLSFCFSFL